MTIIVYNPESNSLQVYTKSGLQSISADQENEIMQVIPDDDVMYVESGHIMTRSQFALFFFGHLPDARAAEQSGPDQSQIHVPPDISAADDSTGQQNQGIKKEVVVSANPTQQYIRATSNRTLLFSDLGERPKDGGPPENPLKLRGKWDFVSVDSVGGIEQLMQNHQFRSMLEKKKIELVDHSYVLMHSGKKGRKISPSAAAHDRIIVDEKVSNRAAATSQDTPDTIDVN